MQPAAVAKGQISGKEIMTLLDQAEGIEDHTKLASAAIPATGISDSKKSHPTSPGPSQTPHDVKIELLDLLFKITEIPVAEMKDELSFDDVGIDSLMVIEVLSEIRKYFHLEIPMSDFQTLTTIKLLYNYLWSKGSTRNAAEVAKAEVSSEDTSDSDTGNDMAPQSSSASSISGEELPERK
jgi:acyl carrier protein